MLKNKKVCIIGLGYVGLPLAILSTYKKFNTFGVDINLKRIKEIKKKNIIIDDYFCSKIFNEVNLINVF